MSYVLSVSTSDKNFRIRPKLGNLDAEYIKLLAMPHLLKNPLALRQYQQRIAVYAYWAWRCRKLNRLYPRDECPWTPAKLPSAGNSLLKKLTQSCRPASFHSNPSNPKAPFFLEVQSYMEPFFYYIFMVVCFPRVVQLKKCAVHTFPNL